MEGSRLIIKRRRIPRGQQRIALLVGLGGLAAFMVMVAQFRMTLSNRTLAAVQDDVSRMHEEYTEPLKEEVVEQGTNLQADVAEDTDLAALKTQLEILVTPPPDQAAAHGEDTETVPSEETTTDQLSTTQTETP